MSDLTLVVGGAPALAAALGQTGQFAGVHAVGSTGELKNLVAGGVLPQERDRLVFLFADTLPSEQPPALDDLVRKLASSGRKVVILAASPNARDMVAANPSAGLLEGPFNVNLVLGGLSGLGLGMLAPDPNGFAEINPFVATPAEQPASQDIPAWSGWGAEQEQSQQPAPAPQQPAPWGGPAAAEPVEAAPAQPVAPGGGWGEPTGQQPAPAPGGWGEPAG